MVTGSSDVREGFHLIYCTFLLLGGFLRLILGFTELFFGRERRGPGEQGTYHI